MQIRNTLKYSGTQNQVPLAIIDLLHLLRYMYVCAHGYVLLIADTRT